MLRSYSEYMGEIELLFFFYNINYMILVVVYLPALFSSHVAHVIWLVCSFISNIKDVFPAHPYTLRQNTKSKQNETQA